MDEQEIMDRLQFMLMRLLRSLEEYFPITENDCFLIMNELDTPGKMNQFGKWILTKLDGDLLNSSLTEVTRAAVRIGAGRTDLP